MNDLENKKLRESNNLKVKRIAYLEAQLETSKKLISDHKCVPDANNSSQNVTANVFHDDPMAPKDQQTRVSFLENRTLTLEQSLASLTNKFETFQISSIVAEKVRENLHQTVQYTHLYSCHECDYESKDKSNLKAHIESHHYKPSKIEPFRCGQCTYLTNNKDDMNLHTENCHSDPEVYFCDVCEYSTQHHTILKKHKFEQHKYASPRYFFSRSRQGHKPQSEYSKARYVPSGVRKNIAAVQEQHTNPQLNSDQLYSRFSCDSCQKWFEHEDAYGLHMNYYHGYTKDNANAQY